MGYVGNEPSVNFTSFAKQDITGDGGASYTLTYAVANANEIEVFVNNVRQEPSVAYTVSGTALTMTGNVASTDDFYVIYLGKALQTTTPPDGSVSTAKIADDAVTSAKISYPLTTFSSTGIDDNATSTAITIDSSERIGIGVTPTAQFSHNILQIGNQATLGANAALSTTGQTYLTHNLYYDTGGTLQVYNTSSANEGALLQLVDGQLRFSASDSTTGTPTVDRCLTVSKDGDLYVNTTSNSPNPGVVARYNGIVGIGKNNSVSGNSFMEFRRNGTQIGSVTQSGTTGVSYNTSSDHRLKENVTADWDATTRLKQLNPVRFNFIADADTTVDGFLAHEVQSVVPEAITGTHNEVDDDGNPVYQGIDQSKLVPLLVKTIQELEARITALENS